MDSTKHNRTVERLDRTRALGGQAEAFLAAFEPVLRRRQDKYVTELLANTRDKGEVDDSTVYKLIALEDIMTDLTNASARGVTAQKKLNEILNHAGGSTDE